MNLDRMGNIADIVAIPIAILGVYLIIHQLYLSRKESEKEHKRKKKELTLNHYVDKRIMFSEKNGYIIDQLNLNNNSSLTDEQLQQILDSTELKKSMKYILSFLSNFGVGVKHDVYDLDILSELSGTAFINVFNRYYPYIKYIRESYSKNIYVELQEMIEIIALKKNLEIITK